MSPATHGSGEPPAADRLLELDADTWAWVLPRLRATLRSLEAPSPELVALRDLPTGRLAGGRDRRRACRAIADDPALWEALQARLGEAEPVPAGVQALLHPPEVTAGPGADGSGESPGATEAARRRSRERLRAARDERDRWQRKAAGETARAASLEARLADLDARNTQLVEELAHARRELLAAGEELERAVQRERRRRDRELREARDEAAALRRADEQRRQQRRRAAEEVERAARDAERARGAERGRERPLRVVPGRPTELPAGVARGTTTEATLLLHRGRLVLVDGYNVTLRHRGHLDLETQRTWLVKLLATLVARVAIRPVVVFDGRAAGGGRPAAGLREVEVRFTHEGITADDEIVLAVEGTDDPVVVVTDDRELTARVRVTGADVLSTGQLLAVAS